MSQTRDDFSQRTRNDLALRASYFCSFCKCPTVGPSDEKTNGVTMVGIAAHICAAAPGQGARRYDLAMSREQRSHIDNGIWLCATCSVLVDRDEERFTVNELHRIKREHESSRRLGALGTKDEGDIIAIGPEIIAVGSIIWSAPEGTRVRLFHFLNGSGRDLWSLTRDFRTWPAERRYALFNELGFGALLAEPPTIEKAGGSYEVQFKLQEQAPRQAATTKITAMCRETGGALQGLEAHIQNFESILGMAQGTWSANLASGSDLSDLYWRYKGSPWFDRLAMMEMIRLSSIPTGTKNRDGPWPPFQIVRQVNRIETKTSDLKDQILELMVEFELEAMGRWEHSLSVFISTPKQLVESRQNALFHGERIKEIEQQYNA